MLKRFSTLRVSTWCIRPTSTVKTGASNREGMVVCCSCLLERTSCYNFRDTTAVECSRGEREAEPESSLVGFRGRGGCWVNVNVNVAGVVVF